MSAFALAHSPSRRPSQGLLRFSDNLAPLLNGCLANRRNWQALAEAHADEEQQHQQQHQSTQHATTTALAPAPAPAETPAAGDPQ